MIKFLSLKCMLGVCKFFQILDGFGLIMKKVALQHTIFFLLCKGNTIQKIREGHRTNLIFYLINVIFWGSKFFIVKFNKFKA